MAAMLGAAMGWDGASTESTDGGQKRRGSMVDASLSALTAMGEAAAKGVEVVSRATVLPSRQDEPSVEERERGERHRRG